MKRLAKSAGVGACFCLGALLVSLPASPARGDDGIPAPPPWMDPTDALNPLSLVTGAGIKVGEGTILQPQFGIETGVVSNVFYQDTGSVTAGLLRLMIEIGTSSLPDQRLRFQPAGDTQEPTRTASVAYTEPGDFQYSANLFATWDQYLSTNSDVTAQGGLGGGLLLRGIVNPHHPLQFSFQENFSRVIRATNFESRSDTNRDLNSLGLRLSYIPTGR